MADVIDIITESKSFKDIRKQMNRIVENINLQVENNDLKSDVVKKLTDAFEMFVRDFNKNEENRYFAKYRTPVIVEIPYEQNIAKMYEELTNEHSKKYFQFNVYSVSREEGYSSNIEVEIEDWFDEPLKDLLKKTVLEIFPQLNDNQELLNDIVNGLYESKSFNDGFLKGFVIPEAISQFRFDYD